MPSCSLSPAPAGARGRRLARALAAVLTTAALTATSVTLAAGMPRAFQLAAQTSTGVTVWAESCVAASRTLDATGARQSRAGQPAPQPHPQALAALVAALHHGDFQARGVHVVETAAVPMTRFAGQRPGAPGTYFELCDVAIRTAYE